MPRVTLKDIADHAQVGVATVDRVINRRAPVTPATARRVLAAANALNYHAHGLVRHRIEELRPARKLGFILQKESKWFYQMLAGELVQAAKNLRSTRATAEIRFVESLSPHDLAQAVGSFQKRVDAIGLVAVDHALVNAAVASSAESGVPVFALLSPLNAPVISGYVGIDGRKAGRTAGWAMSALARRSGQIGIMIGSHRYLGHELREVGFRSYLREYASHFQLKDSVVYLDDAAVAYEATSEILRASPDLAGLYHCGGGAQGGIHALEESGRAKEITYICHEYGPKTAQGLLEGTVDLVIDSPAKDIAAKTVRAMVRSLDGRPLAAADLTSEFRLITPENC